MIPIVTVIRPVVIVLLISIVLWLALGFGLKDFHRGAIFSTVAVAMSFLFKEFQEIARFFFIPRQFEFFIWGSATVILACIFAWKFKWHRFANVLSIALIVTSAVQVCFGYFQALSLRPEQLHSLAASSKSDFHRPDIIYVILDGYGRNDSLKRSLGFDNSTFINALEERGFYVAKDSRSNYCQTELSVGSSLNFDFIQALLTKVSAKDTSRLPMGELINHSAAAQYLKAMGYTFSAITTGFPPLQFESADVNLRTRSGMTLLESAILQKTPFASYENVRSSQFLRRREEILAAFDSISSLRGTEIKPKFTVAHILAPHPPFVFGSNGQLLPHKGFYGFWDGSDFIEHVSSANDYKLGYVGQAEYIGKLMIKAIDSVLSSSGEKPVILIQGDHGSKLRLDQNSLSRTDLNECFPNLSAFYVPDSVRKHLYPSITPVNSFRVLFNGLFNEDFELKPDLSWYSTFQFPYDFTDVTNRIADHTAMRRVRLPN